MGCSPPSVLEPSVDLDLKRALLNPFGHGCCQIAQRHYEMNIVIVKGLRRALSPRPLDGIRKLPLDGFKGLRNLSWRRHDDRCRVEIVHHAKGLDMSDLKLVECTLFALDPM